MRNNRIKNDPGARKSGRREKPAPRRAENLSGPQRLRLRSLLDAPADYVADPAFSRSNAERKLFEQAPEIPEPNTSWYHPVMDDASGRTSKSVVNVVLDAEQERALFLQFNFARYRVNRLLRELDGKRPTAAQGRELLRWDAMAHRLRDQIARSNLALVLAMAKRVRHTDLDFGDLISEGNMALLRAIDKFNVSRGFKFSTYACRAILKAFSRSGMKQTQYRQLFPTDFDPLLERSDYQRRKYDEHENDCATEVRRIVADNRADLTDVERAIIHHRFALNAMDSETQPLTLEQVGHVVGLTKERVRQIQNKALEKIRKVLEGKYLDGNGHPKNAEGFNASDN